MLTNSHTSGAYGFDGKNQDWPSYNTETFDLSA